MQIPRNNFEVDSVATALWMSTKRHAFASFAASTFIAFTMRSAMAEDLLPHPWRGGPKSDKIAVMEQFLTKCNCLTSIFLVVLMALGIAAPARAQGTSGQVPDPMSSVELSRLMNLYVHPTKEQGVSIESLHDGYRERFRLLRENEIERFLTKAKEMQTGLPKREQMDQFSKSYDRVNKQIAEIDDAFFDGVVTLMGEERRISVERARGARSRTRLNDGILKGMMTEYPSVDLSNIALEMGLTPEELATIDPMLTTYEQNLTASLKDLSITSMRMMRDMFDELEKAGFGELSQEDMMKDPEKMQQVIETMQSAMAKAGERVKAKSKKLSEFNNANCKSLAGQLAGDSKRKLRSLYLEKAYPELSGNPAGANMLFKIVLKQKKLDETTREQIRAAYIKWQAADEAFVEQSIKKIDEDRTNSKFMDFTDTMGQMKKVQERRTQRNEIASSALKSVSTLVVNPQLRKLFENSNDGKIQEESIDFIDDGDDTSAGEDLTGINARASKAEDPQNFGQTVITDLGPMSEEIIASIAGQLALDDSGKALLKLMHQDYMKKWNEEIRAEQSRVDGLDSDRWAWDAKNPEDMTVDEAKQTAYFNGRKALLAKSLDADTVFLNDVASVLGEKSIQVLQMAKLERSLDRTAGGKEMFGGLGSILGAPELLVNIVTVLNSVKLAPEDRAKVHEALNAQIDPLIRAQMDSLSASIDLDREQAEMNIMQAAATLIDQENGKPDMAAAMKLGMELTSIMSRQEELKTQRTAALRAAWTTAIAPLSETQRASLQLAFDERAFPSIFKDARSAIPYIEKALALHDLSDDQRKQLQALSQATRSEHMEFCRKMIPKRAAGAQPAKMEDMQQYWQEQMQVANAMEKVRFERDEQSQRAISSIRRILNDNQASQVNGIADYEKSAVKKKSGPFGI